MTDENHDAPKILDLPTQRSLQHFNIGHDKMPKEVYHAYG